MMEKVTTLMEKVTRTSLVHALWEGTDSTEDLWRHMSHLHSGVRELEGGLVLIDDLPGCVGMCLRLQFLGIGDGIERRELNKQQSASSSTPMDDSDMSSSHAKMTMPTASKGHCRVERDAWSGH